MQYDQDFITMRSMPFWCVANPLPDPFGGRVLEPISSVDTAKLIAWGARQGYLEATGFHDDDLVDWNPDTPEDDLDPAGRTYATLREIKEILDEAGVVMNSAVCNLHGNKIFRNGGLCNPDPEIRRLARLKVERTLRIGNFFQCRTFHLLGSPRRLRSPGGSQLERGLRLAGGRPEPRPRLHQIPAFRQLPRSHNRTQTQRTARPHVSADQRPRRRFHSRQTE